MKDKQRYIHDMHYEKIKIGDLIRVDYSQRLGLVIDILDTKTSWSVQKMKVLFEEGEVVFGVLGFSVEKIF